MEFIVTTVIAGAAVIISLIELIRDWPRKGNGKHRK